MKIVAALLICFPMTLFALNGGVEIGVGAKSKGMGGVGIALPQDAFASAFNPAALFCVGNRIDLGVGYTDIGGRNAFYSRSTGSIDHRISGPVTSPELWFPEFAISKRCGCNHAIGFAAFVKGGISTKYDHKIYFNPGEGSHARFDAYTIFLTPSWSYQINSCFAFGIALNGIIQRHRNNVNYGNMSVGPNLPNGQYVGQGRVGLSGGVNLRLGILMMPTSNLRIGLTYQSHPLMSKMKEYAGQWPRSSYWDWPAEMGIGGAYHFCDCLLLSVDWNYFPWSKTAIYGNRTFNPLGKAGSAAGAGLGWVDQTIWKIGVAWTPRKWLTVRAGYNFGNSPAVPQENYINPLSLACVENHATVGASLRSCIGEITIYYYHGFQKTLLGQGPSYLPSGAGSDVAAFHNGFGIAYGLCW
jgi:long-chain fatty acid transport protein